MKFKRTYFKAQEKPSHLFVITFLLLFAIHANAQINDLTGKKLSCELAIDMQHFFSDGVPDKVLFKINVSRRA
jgi:hypothetical protein